MEVRPKLKRCSCCSTISGSLEGVRACRHRVQKCPSYVTHNLKISFENLKKAFKRAPQRSHRGSNSECRLRSTWFFYCGWQERDCIIYERPVCALDTFNVLHFAGLVSVCERISFEERERERAALMEICCLTAETNLEFRILDSKCTAYLASATSHSVVQISGPMLQWRGFRNGSLRKNRQCLLGTGLSGNSAMRAIAVRAGFGLF